MEESQLSMNEKMLSIDLAGRLHWNNSSNVLCNYMKRQEYLNLILRNRAIIPRYVMEPVDYLNLGEIKTICFPMTCFCDIPFSKVSTHMSRYGEYGIGLDKQAVLNAHRVQPIHYMNEGSPLVESFQKAFLSCLEMGAEPMETSMEILVEYLLNSLVYMKPIWGQSKDNTGNLVNYVYQDECEWRYIPSEIFPEELKPMILPQNKTTKQIQDMYSAAMVRHRECWLSFQWDDVRYLMVPDEKAAKDTIDTILDLSIDTDQKHLLMTKVEISRRFSDNM